MIEFSAFLIEIDCIKRAYKGFAQILIEGLVGVIAFVDGLQKVKKHSGRFVEGLWVCEDFVQSSVPVVLWSGSCCEGLYSEVLRRVHGSARLEIWLIPRWGPYHGWVGGAENAERGRIHRV